MDIGLKGIIDDTQAAFRKERSTIDNVYVLRHVMEREIRKKGGKVFAFFIDLRATSDIVNRDKLWDLMKKKGVRIGLVERVKEIYQEVKNVMNVEEEAMTEIWTKREVRQSCCLSSTLFSLYISDMEQTLSKTVGTKIKVGKRRFCLLAYVNDLVAKMEEDCKRIMRKLEAYLDEKELSLNVTSPS